jgi:hypothetical protein
MPPRDSRTSERDRGFEDDDIDITFEEYIGPGFVSRGRYDEVVWPPAVEVCETCGQPLAPAVIETVAVEVRADALKSRPRPRRHLRPDWRIAEDLNEALTWHPDVDASDIEVEVHDGEVTLTGFVRDRSAHRLVAELTLQTPGVCEVRDELRLGRRRAA